MHGCIQAANITSLLHPLAGESKFGLFSHCDQTLYAQELRETCHDGGAPPTWKATAAFLIMGVLLLILSSVETVRSFLRVRHALKRAKWLAFGAGRLSPEAT